MPEEPIRVLIADDQALIREGLALLLGQFEELEVVGVASDGESAVAMATELRPDVVLMDIVMPGMDGVDATRQITTVLPRTQVVILSAYADDESIFAAIGAGASGYLTKDSGGEQIRRAIATVQAGGALLDPHVQKRLLEHVRSITAKRSPDPPHDLTQREVEVLHLISHGLSNAEIAGRLFVSEATVKTHVNNILAKTHLRDRAQAVAYAFIHGLTEEE
ncbi:MAG TPA: response regulator transcription factor [Candidatus Dormibacteraeota bacterium]|jgi:DNA-binding NarL/FixJ family response regulator